MNEPHHESPLIEHLTELRKRVMIIVAAWLVAFCACYYFAPHIFDWISHPLENALKDSDNRRLIYTNLTETFFVYIRIAFYAAFFVAFPVIAVQFYLFLAPGLYKNEKRVLLPYLILSPLLFFAGVALTYYYVLPAAYTFLAGFERPALKIGGLPIEFEPKVNEYQSITLQIMFAFGLSFQMPVALTLMVRMGMLSVAKLTEWRRYAVVIMSMFAAVITPPDPLSMIALLIPLCLLYEISIIACRLIEKRKAEDDIEAEKQEDLANHA